MQKEHPVWKKYFGNDVMRLSWFNTVFSELLHGLIEAVVSIIVLKINAATKTSKSAHEIVYAFSSPSMWNQRFVKIVLKLLTWLRCCTI